MLYTQRRTKIIATLGPATDAPGMVERLIEAGVDVVRLNFSHGTHEQHGRRIHEVRRVSKKLNRPVAVLLDLQGPKIRTGLLEGGRPIKIKKGDELVLTSRRVMGKGNVVPVTFAGLIHAVEPGERILMDDGSIELRVLDHSETDVRTVVLTSGSVGEHKGVNLPGLRRGETGLTAKDRRDLLYGLEQDVDYVALSFVRSARDIDRLRAFFKKKGFSIPVIAKIEKPEAIDCLDEILEVSDGVMIARGDLGVEMSVQQVPILQKEIIAKANSRGIIVITATQMLESMIDHPRPTRAEASDIANAVFDGTDALMLSGETARGSFPVESVRTMAEIALEAERSLPLRNGSAKMPNVIHTDQFSLASAQCAAFAANVTHARAILVFSMTGRTAILLSKLKPDTPIVVLTTNEHAYRRCALCRGVSALVVPHADNTDRMIQDGEKAVLRAKFLQPGATCVIVSGQVRHLGSTNMVRLSRIGT